MPPKRVQPQFARQNKMFVALVAKYLALKDWDKPTLALKMHTCPRNLYSKIQAPGKTTLDQFRRMCAALGLTDDEILTLIK